MMVRVGKDFCDESDESDERPLLCVVDRKVAVAVAARLH